MWVNTCFSEQRRLHSKKNLPEKMNAAIAVVVFAAVVDKCILEKHPRLESTHV
jgi:hypothetical protein